MIRFLLLSHPDRRELGSVEVEGGLHLRTGGRDAVLDAFAIREGFAHFDALVEARPEFAMVYLELPIPSLTVLQGGRS